MKIFSVINYKGGTGKTSTVVHIAAGLALRGKKVLIIDTDPQGSAAHHLGVAYQSTLYDLIMGKKGYLECVVSARQNIDMICSNERLFPAEVAMARMAKRELVLSKRLKDLEGYDYVILDCPPSMNVMNQNSLLLSDEVLLPVSMEYLSLVGVKQLLQNIKIINKIFNREIFISNVIPTFYDKRNRKSAFVLDSLNRVFPKFVTSPIRTSVSLSEAPGFKQTVFEFDPSSKGAEDYHRLVEEVFYNE
ncbi:MAG: chromosome partitioning protein [Candidatus Marinamargulisbacteria bacterium]|jgi:chromosome partitioning protein